MLFAFWHPGTWLILAFGGAVIVLLLLPATRPYVQATVRSVKTLVSCILGAAILIFTGIAIAGDLEYLLVGREAEATVTKVDRRAKDTRIEYRFTDADGILRTGVETTANGWIEPQDGKVTIQYLPGHEDRSRVSRYIVHWFPYLVVLRLGTVAAYDNRPRCTAGAEGGTAAVVALR
jgi:hypothetical protein